MRMIYLAFAVVASLFATAANAANFTAKDASAATIIFTNPGNCTTGCTPIFSWSDSTGTNLVAVLTAGADGASNTANGGLTYARNLVFNGTTWDRWTGAVTLSAETTKVIGTVRIASGGVASGSYSSGAFASGAYSPGSIAAGAMVDLLTVIGTKNNGTAATNSLLAGGVYNSSPLTLTNTQQASLQLDSAGNLKVTGGGGGAITAASGSYASGAMSAGSYAAGALAAGAFATGAGVDGWDITQGAKTDAVCTLPATTTACSVVSLLKAFANSSITALPAQSNTTTNIGNVGNIAIPNGGATPTGNIAANNTTAVVVKAGAGTLYGVQLAGLGSAPAYLKIYNATSATCGSGTPVKRLMIPAASTAANGAGSNITFGAVGVNFSTGITYCVTTGIGDADTTAPAASTFLVNLDWN